MSGFDAGGMRSRLCCDVAPLGSHVVHDFFVVFVIVVFCFSRIARSYDTWCVRDGVGRSSR